MAIKILQWGINSREKTSSILFHKYTTTSTTKVDMITTPRLTSLYPWKFLERLESKPFFLPYGIRIIKRQGRSLKFANSTGFSLFSRVVTKQESEAIGQRCVLCCLEHKKHWGLTTAYDFIKTLKKLSISPVKRPTDTSVKVRGSIWNDECGKNVDHGRTKIANIKI